MNPGYKQLLEDLNQRCVLNESGVLHLYTRQNHYGRIALTAGEITHLTLHTARGMTAAPVLLDAAISSHRFEAGATLPLMSDLLDTPDLLAMLGTGELPMPAVAAPSVMPVASPNAVIADIATAVPEPPSGISASALMLIEQELQKELGPMATSLVQECLPRAKTAQALAEALADQLMPNEGAKFLARTNELLRGNATP